MDIHIFWAGPFSFDDLNKLNDASKDFGVYQVYGHHPIYGSNVLLYIGQAIQQTYKTRFEQEKWWWEQPDSYNFQFYIGRLAGKNAVSGETWDSLIDRAEKLLIHAHQPVYNMKNKNSIPEWNELDVHVFNWDFYRDLFPEVSGSRFTSKFVHIEEKHIYCKSRITG